ncbi:MAG: hypothetical protein Q8O72_01810 [Bacteroidales bacterium]|nr:hypothetical protein [Bacteroidales bacterium]
MQIRNYSLLILFFLVTRVFCQSEYYASKTRWVSVETVGGESRFEILTEWRENTLQLNKHYYFYDRGKMSFSQGAFAGYLLNGQYLRFRKNSTNLAEKGRFRNGLKTGKWIQWSENGTIVEVENWKRGLKNGTSTSYDSSQQMTSKRNYKNGELSGWQYQYENEEEVQKKKYRHNQINEKGFLGVKWKNPFIRKHDKTEKKKTRKIKVKDKVKKEKKPVEGEPDGDREEIK